MKPGMPRLYGGLADWWHLLSPVEDYAEEAEVYARILREHSRRPVDALLELGSGGGNNAHHLKRSFTVTLVDASPAMLEQSRRVNPECEHVEGDMRTVRLQREFDAVFVHDAIDYMTSIGDLRRAIETGFVHCRAGGVAMFAPDWVAETFRPGTDHGGTDVADRAMRYLEWSRDPDPSDTVRIVDYAVMLRLSDGAVRVEHDRHELGLFSRQAWRDALGAAGFEPASVSFRLGAAESPDRELWLGIKP